MLWDLLRVKKYRFKYVSSTHGLSEAEKERLVSRLPADWLEHWRRCGVLKNIEAESRVDFHTLEPGRKIEIFSSNESGVIASIWLTINSSDRRFLRTTIVRAYWDGEQDPSVESPIGDFFLQGHRVYSSYPNIFANSFSLPIGLSSGGFFSYFPMPFKKARIEIENRGLEEIQSLYYIIGYYTEVETEDMLRFHAIWNRERQTRLGEPYLIFKGNGRGLYVGTYLYMRGLSSKKPIIGGLGFLEGNVTFVVDGHVAYSSTGTEDYFLSGWYFAGGTFNGPFHGLLHKDEERGEIAAYRFHILDPIPFNEYIEVFAPHGEFNEVSADYCSVAYWYQLEDHKHPFRLKLEDIY